MVKVITLNLGQGNFKNGFPHVTATLFDEKYSPLLQCQGSLPPASDIELTYKRWQLLYNALLKRLNWSARIEIERDSILQVSEVDFEQLCQQLKTELNQWLDSHEFLRKIELPLSRKLDQNDEIYIILQTENNLLRQLPWHLWDFFEDFNQAEMALSAPEYQCQTQSSTRLGRVRILVILGNSKGINVEADCRVLKALPNAELLFLCEPSRQELDQSLRDKKGWDILFFAGHSRTEEETGKIYINQNQSLTIPQLQHALRWAISRGLQLAIFNSCDGLGLAQQLEELHIPQVIVMEQPVPDLVAQAFLKHFLSAFAQGESFYLALRQAREKLQALEGQFPCASWLPVTFQNPTVIPPTWEKLAKTALPPPPLWQQLITVLFVGLICTGLVTGSRSLGWLQGLELKAFDQLMRIRPSEPVDKRILIVTVDEGDIQYQREREMKREGSLSDEAFALLLKKIILYQPRVIASDIFHDSPYKPELKTLLKKNENFVAICRINTNTLASISAPPDLRASQVGFTNFPLDPDGVIRRQLIGMSPDRTCQTERSFSLRIALCYLALEVKLSCPPKENYWAFDNTALKKLEPNAGGYQMNPDEAKGYQIFINYRAAEFEQVSLREILAGEKDTELSQLVRERIILIGVAEEDKDKHLTPYSSAQPPSKMSGVTIHAHLVSQLLSAVLERRPLLRWWSQWGETLWIGGWAIAGGILTLFWQKKQNLIVYLLSIVAISLILSGSCFLFLLDGIWVPLIPSGIALILTASGTAIVFSLLSSRSGKPRRGRLSSRRKPPAGSDLRFTVSPVQSWGITPLPTTGRQFLQRGEPAQRTALGTPATRSLGNPRNGVAPQVEQLANPKGEVSSTEKTAPIKPSLMNRQKFSRQKLFSTSLIFSVLTSWLISPMQAWAQSNSLIADDTPTRLTAAKKEAPDFSGEGRPGRQTSGDSRSDCPSVKVPLTALLPTSNWGKTVAERPTLWFYVPYFAEQVPIGEFVLQDEERNTIERLSFTLPKTPGLVSFTLPISLEVGEWYRWYFNLFCEPLKAKSPVFVQGWIQRVVLNSNLKSQLEAAGTRDYLIYTNNQIWYDAIAHLAELRLTKPTDATLEESWTNLLTAKEVNLQRLTQEPIVGSINKLK